MKPFIIIEHLEEDMGLWILLEYRHSSIIYGREYLWVTNIPRKYHAIVSIYAGRVFEESIVDLIRRGFIDPSKTLILDPEADKMLSYDDVVYFNYIVIGGILGDHPPRKRTEKLLSSRLKGVERRHIGEGQYSIDGSVYYVDYLWKHKGMNGYKFVDGVTIKTANGYIRLPFRYPLLNDKPLIAPGLREYLITGKFPDKIRNEIIRKDRITGEKQ